MTVIDFMQRKQQIADRGEQLRAGQITEDVFRASLAGMGLRRDDIAVMVDDNRPAPRFDHEQARYEASLDWLREYLAGERGWVAVMVSSHDGGGSAS